MRKKGTWEGYREKWKNYLSMTQDEEKVEKITEKSEKVTLVWLKMKKKRTRKG